MTGHPLRGRFRVLVGSQQCTACGIHRTFRCRFCDAVCNCTKASQ